MKIKYIIDAHTHIGFWPTLRKTETNLVSSSKNNGISYSLFSFDGSEFKDSNTFFRDVKVMDALKKSLSFIKRTPKGFGMLIWIRPNKEHNLKELENFIIAHRSIIHGIKFHPALSHLKITSKKVLPYILLAQKYNLPVLVHTALDKYSSIFYLEDIASEFKDVNFVAAHMELKSDHTFTIAAMKKYSNIYCDTAWVDSSIIKLLRKEHLIDRVMFGTDNPIDGEETLDNPIYQAYLKNKMKCNKKEYQMLMYKNAQKIYNVPDSELK